MEFVVGALVVLGFLAILTRFITRDASGGIRLPRIIDDSIGMWALRRITGRRLLERPWDDELVEHVEFDPNSGDSTPAALGAIAAANSADPTLGPREVTATRYVASRRRKREIVASPTPVADLRRRTQTHRKGAIVWRQPSTALASLAAVLIIAAVAVGAMALSPGHAASASPPRTLSSQLAAVLPSRATPSPSLVAATASPSAAILSIQKATIPGRSGLRVYVHWSISETGSGLKSQLLQRRTDSGAWVTVSLESITTRSISFALARGHAYTFRVRATDKAGNVGAFASRLIRI